MNFKTWLESTEERYSNEMTERLCSWIKLHGRKPRTGSGPILSGSPTAGSRVSYNVDLEENRLGEFLKEKIRSGQTYPSDLAILQRHGMEELFEKRRPDSRWASEEEKRTIVFNNIEKLAEYYKKNGRYPTIGSTDPELVYLGRWLVFRRRTWKGIGKGRIYDGENEFGINLGLPKDWLDQDIQAKQVEQIELNLLKLAEYYKKNGRYPKIDDPDPEVKSLGFWLQSRRQVARGAKARRAYEGEKELGISLGLPKNWLDRDAQRDQNNELSLLKLAEYYKKNGHYPKRSDPDPEVSYLGGWLQSRRKARRGAKGKVRDDEKEIGISLGLPEDWLDYQGSARRREGNWNKPGVARGLA